MNALSSSIRFPDLSDETKIPQRSQEHVCAPGLRTVRFKSLKSLLFTWLLLAGASSALSQTNGDQIVATVDGTPITLSEVDAAATAKVFSLQQQVFALRKVALENLVKRRILEIEAAHRGVSIEVLRRQLMEGPVEVAPTKLEELYTENLLVFASMNADEAKEKLRLDLEAQQRLKRYREELTKLRNTHLIETFLEEPRLPISRSSDLASLGPADADVVITEFSDFQCPYCKEVQTTLKQVVSHYGNKVRLDFKHLPLEQHTLAPLLAQAAFCSGKQGRFWQFKDALFASDSLSREFMSSTANKVGLTRPAFDECLASAESRAAIVADLQDAKRLGIESTPTFLINGKLLKGAASFEQFRTVIDRELKSVKTSSTGQQP